MCSHDLLAARTTVLIVLACAPVLLHGTAGAADRGQGAPALERGRSGPPASMQGNWRIASRALDAGGKGAERKAGVQPDVDPAEAKLQVDAKGIRWNPAGGVLKGHCEKAIYDGALDDRHLEEWRGRHRQGLRNLKVEPSQVGAAFFFQCAEARPDWGPHAPDQAQVFTLKDGRLLLGWYDRLLLVLEKQR